MYTILQSISLFLHIACLRLLDHDHDAGYHSRYQGTDGHGPGFNDNEIEKEKDKYRFTSIKIVGRERYR